MLSIATSVYFLFRKQRTLEGDLVEEVALWRLTSLSRWSKAKFKSPCNFEESPYVAARSGGTYIFSTCHIMKMSISCTCLLKSIVSVIKYFESDFLGKYSITVYRNGVLPIVRQPISWQPINARGIPSLINILQGIPTDHEGGSYIHVPYITESRPYMSTHPFFFAAHTGHEFAEMCPLTRDFSITRRVPGIW